MRPIREDQRLCPTCKGTGINPVRTYMVCPKCNGEKIIARPVRFRGPEKFLRVLEGTLVRIEVAE